MVLKATTPPQAPQGAFGDESERVYIILIIYGVNTMTQAETMVKRAKGGCNPSKEKLAEWVFDLGLREAPKYISLPSTIKFFFNDESFICIYVNSSEIELG